MEKQEHFIVLHASNGDSRLLYLNADFITAVHTSFDPEDGDDETPCYRQTVVYLLNDVKYRVNESVDEVICAIERAYIRD